MKSMSSVFNVLKSTMSKKSPELLIAAGIAGFVTTTVLSVRATPKAMRLLDEAENKKEEKLTNIEKVKVAWKPYIPAVISGVTSIACIILSQSVNAKRGAALATAYKLSESAFATYRNKVVETIGEEKEKEIQKEVNKEKIEKDPPVNNEIIITGNGESLCYDSVSGRYFQSSIENIKAVINTMNYRLINDVYVSLNDVYYELGLENTPTGDELGWNINDGLIDIHFDTCMSKDGRPAIVLDYLVGPKHGYSKFI